MEPTEPRLKALMVRSLDGDATAYRELLGDLARLFHGYFARRLGGDAAAAEDLVQETLTAVHTRRSSYDRARPFTPWAYAMAHHKLVDHLRRHAARPVMAIEETGEPTVDPHETLATAASELERLMAALPAKQRESIRLTKIDGFSLVETARRTGLSVAAVKVSVHRGLKALSARARQRASRRAD